MPVIRRMLIVCFACVWAATAVAQDASDNADIQAMRYATSELKIEFRPELTQEQAIRDRLMLTPLQLTLRGGEVDAAEKNDGISTVSIEESIRHSLLMPYKR